MRLNHKVLIGRLWETLCKTVIVEFNDHTYATIRQSGYYAVVVIYSGTLHREYAKVRCCLSCSIAARASFRNLSVLFRSICATY